MIGPLVEHIGTFVESLRRKAAVNVNDKFSKAHINALALEYFNQAKPDIERIPDQLEKVAELDSAWMQLIQLAQGNNPRRSYIRLLTQLRRELGELNFKYISVVTFTKGTPAYHLSRQENQILGTLESLLPSAAASYRQGIADLSKDDRLSFRGTATEFRESLRETLDHLAQDDDVMAQDWFQLEENQKKPTMRQKCRHILISRAVKKGQRDVTEKTVTLVEELLEKTVRDVYTRASIATHIQESKREVERIKNYVDAIFYDLLEIPLSDQQHPAQHSPRRSAPLALPEQPIRRFPRLAPPKQAIRRYPRLAKPRGGE